MSDREKDEDECERKKSAWKNSEMHCDRGSSCPIASSVLARVCTAHSGGDGRASGYVSRVRGWSGCWVCRERMSVAADLIAAVSRRPPRRFRPLQ